MQKEPHSWLGARLWVPACHHNRHASLPLPSPSPTKPLSASASPSRVAHGPASAPSARRAHLASAAICCFAPSLAETRARETHAPAQVCSIPFLPQPALGLPASPPQPPLPTPRAKSTGHPHDTDRPCPHGSKPRPLQHTLQYSGRPRPPGLVLTALGPPAALARASGVRPAAPCPQPPERAGCARVTGHDCGTSCARSPLATADDGGMQRCSSSAHRGCSRRG